MRLATSLGVASLLLVGAAAAAEAAAAAAVASLSLDELDAQLRTCPVVQKLDAAMAAHVAAQPGSVTTRLFGLLFPSARPAVNALLATLYISGPPNLLLALCPTDIHADSLAVMVAFAVGGLLGDTFFHLLPEIFLGEEEAGRARFVLVEPNRNLVLGLALFVGFMTFVAMDKGLRIATGGSGGHAHGHARGHEHEHEHEHDPASAAVRAAAAAADEGRTTGASTRSGEIRSRGKRGPDDDGAKAVAVAAHREGNPSVKLGGFLNLIADFTHNITDGLAMAASFYASPVIGATTTVAVFFHEIPHEVGDYALLVQSGFSKRAAMASQFVTALGALLGTSIGIAVHELGSSGSSSQGEAAMPRHAGIWGTSLATVLLRETFKTWGDMLLPFTAGTFLYVGTVAVIPELLETGTNKVEELRKTAVQFTAVAVGAGVMLYISWHD